MITIEWDKILETIGKLWPGKIENEEIELMWRSALKEFEFGAVQREIRGYAAGHRFFPKPFEIVNRIRAAAAGEVTEKPPEPNRWEVQRRQWIKQWPDKAEKIAAMSDLEVETHVRKWEYTEALKQMTPKGRAVSCLYWNWQDAQWRLNGCDPQDMPQFSTPLDGRVRLATDKPPSAENATPMNHGWTQNKHDAAMPEMQARWDRYAETLK